jgi:hypothetical protein
MVGTRSQLAKATTAPPLPFTKSHLSISVVMIGLLMTAIIDVAAFGPTPPYPQGKAIKIFLRHTQKCP